MTRRIAEGAFIVTTISALAFACSLSTTDDVVIATRPETPPSFVSPDAAEPSEAVEAGSGLVAYCPSNKCPAGRTTCPTSLFLCDVDLKTDRDNCGACGVRCPFSTTSETYECVEGRCQMECATQPPMFDCDGVPDNGCEIKANTNANCGACGVTCSDPAKPCTQRGISTSDVGCGCAGDDLYCAGQCRDGKSDDKNCGACGRTCDSTGDGGARYDNTYYGCAAAECGHLKCVAPWGNCDGDITNGCEVSLLDPANCGICGNTCAPGQVCALNSVTKAPECMCPPGQTFCPGTCTGGVCTGQCFDLSTDRNNCGACSFSCSGAKGVGSNGICTYGVCHQQCVQGRADCNGNTADGCEVNTDNDPMNCGDCGRVCDAVAGQACVGGRCVVEPCDQVDGGQDAGGGVH